MSIIKAKSNLLHLHIWDNWVSLAIIWPANPRAVTIKEEADPEEHIRLLKKQIAVFWDSMPRRREIACKLNGYIYLNGTVQYRCRVEYVVNRETLLHRENEHQYVPSFRRQCLFGRWENGGQHTPSETWIKISKIERLVPPLHINSLLRANGQLLRGVVGGLVYIRDPVP